MTEKPSSSDRPQKPSAKPTKPTSGVAPSAQTPSEAAASQSSSSLPKLADTAPRDPAASTVAKSPPAASPESAAKTSGWVESSRPQSTSSAAAAADLPRDQPLPGHREKPRPTTAQPTAVESTSTVRSGTVALVRQTLLGRLGTGSFGKPSFAIALLALLAIVSFLALRKLDTIATSAHSIADDFDVLKNQASVRSAASAGLLDNHADSPAQPLVTQPASTGNAPASPAPATTTELISVISAMDKIKDSTSATEKRITDKLIALDKQMKEFDQADSDRLTTGNGGVAKIVDVHVGTLSKRLDKIDAAIGRMEARLGRDANSEDVAVVLFHSAKFNVKWFSSVLANVFIKSDYGTVFEHFRVGVFRAANGKVGAPLIPFDPDASRPLTEDIFQIQAPDSTATEITEQFDPAEVFDPKSSAAKRIVLVASAAANPPELTDTKWTGVECYVVLVDRKGSTEDATDAIRLKWMPFCQRPGAPPGEAALVSIDVQSPDKENETKRAEFDFESKLRWYVRPRAVSQEKSQ